METVAASLAGYVRLVRHNRNFRLLWMAQIVSEMGDWLYAVAVYSLLLEFTGSAKSVALAFVLQVLPQFFVAPTAGVLNDRLSRKRVMIFADWVRAGVVFCMILVRGPQLVWLLYLLLFFETIMWALFEPAHKAVIPNITSESEIVIANTLSSTTWSFNFAMGFAIGGVIAAYFGRNTVFVVNALSFVGSALLIGRMRFTETHAQHLPALRAKDLADFSPIREGIHYVWRNPQLRATILVKAGLGLTGSNWVLLPIFGERVFPVHRAGFTHQESGMLGMSVLMACRGIGAILGPLISGYWAGSLRSRMRLGILFAFLVVSIGYLGLAAAPTFPLACAAIIFAHAGGSTLWVFSTTLLQVQTDDRLRGRVFSAEFAFSVLTMSLSSYSAGALIDRGVPVGYVAGLTGLVMLIPALLWAHVLKSGTPASAAPSVEV
jgi:MFS family permease